MTLPCAVVIAGPTASGKSGLALALAVAFDGVVINADSMQVYDALPILTARPGPGALTRVPHRLYGMIDPAEPCSAARWRDLATTEIYAAWEAGRLPVVVGGTGLYLEALMDGLSPIPEIPPESRAEARALFEDLGNADFHRRLSEADPAMAARLPQGDSQRMIRAWEVLSATGRSLAEWQTEPREGAVAARWLTLALTPPRERLRQACDGRFVAMVDAGAITEARDFLERDLDPVLPIMKALGLRDLGGFCRGERSLDDAIAAAQSATRAYAKRQMTWVRHRLKPDMMLDAQLSESLMTSIFAKVRQFRLTPV
ncbi:tRNA (adenosine(37)-N6)-dimethylallyltransferase MiaA [Magnetospirillum fulvum]|uniref:tRNA dimethylallyltransferase n=1 Tax=Magnetospirillum fulvum TaxID=1082 RepID=A0A1H6HVT9_MAGFU|nr:tRNA (adenosine(37)-N6)-dimethylallyltransferase MiaA [Magnetospirillum fulvum]SEH38249.1 tRNA dimethylallyltransferase [Magnetospirillum fulvum]